MELSYILNHLGEDRELYFDAVSPPIIQTSNFLFRSVEDMRKRFQDEMGGYIYSRGLNPTVDILRKKLAALDEAEDALIFNSGASAIFSAVVPFVQQGDHIISVKKPYTWAQKLFNEFLPKFGVETTYVDGTDLNNFITARKENTRIIYLESPNSWDFAIQDLKAVALFAKSKNIITIVDNSYCSPLYQKPIPMGIDMALQSVTKYLNGHSDVVAGVLTGSQSMMRKIFNLEYLTAGNGIQPFNAWLVLRGLRTLPARMDRITKTTHSVIRFLESHPAVETVIFPLSSDFPQYDLARSQMTGACGLLSFVVKCKSLAKIEAFCESLKTILMAVSWGGHESLIIPRAAGIAREAFDEQNVEHRMIRLYVGLEDADYLISDLNTAFEQLL